MKYWILIGWAVLLASACSSPEGKAKRLERQLLEQIPILFADDVLPVIFTPARTDSIRAACQLFRTRMDVQLNSAPEDAAKNILQGADLMLQGYELRAERLRSDPSFYDIGAYLRTTLAQSDPSEKRMAYIAVQLERTKAYYAAARVNLRPTETEKINNAIDIQRNTLLFLHNELPDSIQAAALKPDKKTALLEAVQQSRLEVKDYIAFCRSLLFELQNQGVEEELDKKMGK